MTEAEFSNMNADIVSPLWTEEDFAAHQRQDFNERHQAERSFKVRASIHRVTAYLRYALQNAQKKVNGMDLASGHKSKPPQNENLIEANPSVKSYYPGRLDGLATTPTVDL